MSNEWNWNNPNKSQDGSGENRDPMQESVGTVKVQDQTSVEDPRDAAAASALSEEDPVQGEPAEVQNDDTEQKMAEETAATREGDFGVPTGDDSSESSDNTGREEGNVSGTYHWVNPRMQKNGDDFGNTYHSNTYRENVGSSNENHSSATVENDSRSTPGNGQGVWNRSSSPTGQRHYGSYRMGQEPPVPKRTEKRSPGAGKKILMTAGMAVIFGVIAGGVMFGINYFGNEITGQNQTVEVPSTVTANPSDASERDTGASAAVGEFSVAQVAENAMPSVVSITNASVQTVKDFFGGVQEYPIQSAGSGIIVGQNEEELLIATNNHVVEGAQTLTVSFSDASSYEAQIKGNDTGNDLAVIAVKISDLSQDTLNAIKVISLGDSDSLIIGEQVVAIGNALGYGQSVTSGWVSALDRDMTDEDGNVSEDLIQTDAAINPGNSGGALLNMSGELIGINVAKSSGNAVEGMGYAIPVSKAEPVLDSLMNRETRFKVDEDQAAYVGVTCVNVDSGVTQMYGIPEGAFVDSVEAGGPAEQAGIQANDVITKFDGIQIAGSQELVDRLEYYKAGETVDVVYARAENGEYQEHTVSVTLGKRSEMTQKDPSAER